MSVLAFLVVLTVLVFVHELGHFLVARWFGVRVDAFSIGFGPELIGYTDRRGTRWKLSAIPLGGYVKMFGDADASSRPDASVASMGEAEKAGSLFHKPLHARASVVAAGPIANFVFAFLALAGLFMTVGQPFSPADVGEVMAGSAAERGGIKAGDTVTGIDGASIQRFEEIRQAVALNPGRTLEVTVRRDGRDVSLTVVPETHEIKDRFGNVQRVGLLGIRGGAARQVVHGPVEAFHQAGREMGAMISGTLASLGQIVEGTRGTEELGGPLRIAQMSGEVAEVGLVALISFMAFLSINLGLINLFPIPILDGGHLLFYAVEAVLGRPLGLRAQEYGFRIGLALVITLLVFVTWNDIVQLRLVEFVRGLIS
jgi:regulator of sigma E protease